MISMKQCKSCFDFSELVRRSTSILLILLLILLLSGPSSCRVYCRKNFWTQG